MKHVKTAIDTLGHEPQKDKTEWFHGDCKIYAENKTNAYCYFWKIKIYIEWRREWGYSLADEEEAVINEYLLLKFKDGSLINNVTDAYNE